MSWLARLKKTEMAPEQDATKTTKTVSVVSVGSIPALIQKTGAESGAANDQAPDPDRWAWPHSDAMNTGEIETFTARLARFTDKGLTTADAEALADKLVIRDRDSDHRRLCVECAHCRPGPRCRHGLAVLDVLQRCDRFALDRSVAELGQRLAAMAEPIEFQPDEDPHD